MSPIRVSQTSGVPVYRQIVEQVKFMIEAGQLQDGDRLPSSRMLASNLSVNRNTVARAYRELRDHEHVEARRRGGMVVRGAAEARERARTRARAVRILDGAIHECLRLGLSVDDIASLAYHYGLHAEQLEVSIAFVECNADRAHYFAGELSRRLEAPVTPLVLGAFDPERAFDGDLVLTTFFHLSEVRQLASGHRTEVVAIVVAPHVQTLVQLARIPPARRIGILYSTEEQAQSIRDSLVQAGLHNIDVLSPELENADTVDVVVVPTEMPELRGLIERRSGELGRRIEVIEFGNVLDEASMRMVREVVDELRDRKALTGTLAAPQREPLRAERAQRA